MRCGGTVICSPPGKGVPHEPTLYRLWPDLLSPQRDGSLGPAGPGLAHRVAQGGPEALHPMFWANPGPAGADGRNRAPRALGEAEGRVNVELKDTLIAVGISAIVMLIFGLLIGSGHAP